MRNKRYMSYKDMSKKGQNNIYKEIDMKLLTLEKNEKGLSEEEKKGKYRKALDFLKNEIKTLLLSAFAYEQTKLFPITEEDVSLGDDVCERIYEAYEEAKYKEDVEKFVATVMNEYRISREAWESMVEKFSDLDFTKNFEVYFFSHCFETSSGNIVNLLTGDFWNPELMLWQSRESGLCALALPPLTMKNGEWTGVVSYK